LHVGVVLNYDAKVRRFFRVDISQNPRDFSLFTEKCIIFAA